MLDQPKFNPLVLNQASLQAYLECPRRYELGFLNEAQWPAAHSSPLSKFETLTELGNRFHQLCQQFFLGLDPNLIASTISDTDVLDLWDAFLPYGKTLLPHQTISEQILRIPFQDHYLVAKFDLIVRLSADDYLIIDWKTSSKKPPRTILANRAQSFLYPFVFQQGGRDLFFADSISPSQIRLQYWYPLAEIPEEIFPYSDEIHQEVSQKISELIKQIENNLSDGKFALTDDQEKCVQCQFRSFCERGQLAHPVPAGADLESEDLSNTHFDLDLINEIEF